MTQRQLFLLPTENKKEENDKNVGRARMNVGAAGESLAEFYLWNICDSVMKSNGGASYDLIAEYKSKLWKIQVKTSRYTTHGKEERKYRYEVKRRYKQAERNISTGYRKVIHREYTAKECDMYALVAFESRRVYFMPHDCADKVIALDKRTFDVDDLERVSFEAATRRMATP